MKKTTQTAGIKWIREGFGLTQTQLAAFLNVSSSMLAMAERGQRILPVAALLKLNLLDAHLHTPVPKTSKAFLTQHVQAHASAWRKQLTAQNNELAYQIALQRKRVEIAESKHQQALQGIAFAQTIMQQQLQQNIDKKDLAWAQMLQTQAQQNLRKHHPLQQAALQHKMKALQTEQKGLAKLIKNLS